MAVTEVSPKDEDPIETALEPLDHMEWIDSSGTHGPHDPDGRRVLKPGHPCQVGPGVCAPVAQEGQDFGLEGTTVIHADSPAEILKNLIA
jgi:hypothetical protein